MPTIKLDVDGLRQADAALRRFSDGALGLATHSGLELGERLADEAQARWPLRRRIRTVARIADDGPVPARAVAVFSRHHPIGSRLGAAFSIRDSRSTAPESSGRHR